MAFRKELFEICLEIVNLRGRVGPSTRQGHILNLAEIAYTAVPSERTKGIEITDQLIFLVDHLKDLVAEAGKGISKSSS